MADEVKNEALEQDWDSGLEASYNDNNIPPVGDYGFTVIEFEKTISKKGSKMAKLTIQLDKENGQNWKVTDYIVLTQAWKCAQFFESLSLKKKGEPLDRMPWDKVLGASGRVKIKHELYNAEEYCKVDKYLISEAAQAPTAPAQTAPKKTAPKKASKPEEDLPFEV